MSEFNRIVGVDGNHNFPEPVRKKIFSSTESATFKTGIVNDYKGLIDTSVNAAKSELKTRDDGLETKINAEVGKLNTKIDAAVSGVDSRKMDKVTGGKPGDVLSFDGQNGVWTKFEREVPKIGKTGHVLTKTENGVEWSSAPSPNVIWTKDLQAKAQGFWIVNSTEPPEKPYYTCADGTVVPVIWHQPIEVLIPTIPTRPYFYPDDIKIGVEDRVGLDYYIESYTKDGVVRPLNRKLLPGENDLSNIAQTPFDVKIVVKPRVGYKLPSDFVWNMHYYDPNSAVFFGTETFDDKPNDTYLVNRQFGDSSGYWTYYDVRNSTYTFPMPEPSTFYTNGVNPERDGSGVIAKTYNGKLRLMSGTRWGVIGVITPSEKMKLVMNISRVPQRSNSGFELVLSAHPNSIIHGMHFFFNTTNGVSMTSGGMVTGTYVIESVGDRVSITHPSGEKFVRSVPPTQIDELKKKGRYGNAFGIRTNQGGIDPNDPFEIDYISVTNYGV